MKKLSLQIIIGILRHILTMIGGGLIVQGTISQNTFNLLVGLFCGAIGFIWSIAHKNNVDQAIKDAETSAEMH